MKTPTKIPAWAIAIWVLLALVGVLAVCCLCSVSLSTFRGSRAVSVYTPSSSQSTPNRQATASQNASGKKPRLIFSTNQQQVVAGEPFSVTVRLDPADYQIAEYRFSLQYPKDKISINHPKNDVIITEICEVDYSNAGVTGLGNYNVVHVEMYCKGDPYKGGETPIVIIPFETSEQASGMVRIEPEMVHSNILLRNQVFQETGRSTSNRENLLDPNIEPVIVGIMKKE